MESDDVVCVPLEDVLVDVPVHDKLPCRYCGRICEKPCQNVLCLPAEIVAKPSLNYVQFKYVNQVESLVTEFLF
jgi:hypothetical protein